MGQVIVIVIEGAQADLAVVDALARLQLAARRNGWEIELRGASDELRALCDFVGLPELCR